MCGSCKTPYAAHRDQDSSTMPSKSISLSSHNNHQKQSATGITRLRNSSKVPTTEY
ncbi:hypothetical protein Hanom_Chr04g00280031 [Helianthus anomalus]